MYSITDARKVCAGDFCEHCVNDIPCSRIDLEDAESEGGFYNECRVVDEDLALIPESAPDWANEYDDTLSCKGCAYEDNCHLKV